MRFLKRLSIKNFLIGVMGFLVVLSAAFAVHNLQLTWEENQEIERANHANMLSDAIIEATGFEAVERGVTSVALSSSDPADAEAVRKIQDLRTNGDSAVSRAIEQGRELLDHESGNAQLKSSLSRAESSHSELESARRIVDREIQNSSKGYSSRDWVNLMTSVIDANSELRLAALSTSVSNGALRDALWMSLERKQALWLISEYAGRERATLAMFIAGKNPVDADTMRKLIGFRAIVDVNLKTVLRLKETAAGETEVLDALRKIEDVFMGRFENVRQSVYAAAGTGKYPISGKEWVAESTTAINSILEMSATVGKTVNNRIAADLKSFKWSVASSAATLGAVFAFGVAVFLIIRSKVLSPMLHLNDVMTKVENTNDLTFKIDTKSEDENGRMAKAFNAMLDKFRNIIIEVNNSISHLASAFEELSASALQIANDTKSQGDRASQVAAASQEMRSTTIEIAKNITNVSNAANEANAVALKGGDIVSRTIESMNGIAATARESSQIISTLGSRSQEIGSIVNVIDDIADQTNLLALNAAIEAARAGEQGRGFAVVADEVRKLAEKTMKATKEIGGMIKSMQDGTKKAIFSMEVEVKAVEDGVRLAGEADSSLKEMVHQIMTAIEQQSSATDQISDDIEVVAGVVNETSTSAKQISEGAEEIARLAASLQHMIEVFNIRKKDVDAAGGEDFISITDAQGGGEKDVVRKTAGLSHKPRLVENSVVSDNRKPAARKKITYAREAGDPAVS